ncbi:hypothetical protein LCGC14_2702660 [marine sediment metagenome]|uniref:Uncharacterized protein n=1 Tax=marine sediment metagenome TaxID=412755 RepID=A0A0F9C784_9ZZZZ
MEHYSPNRDFEAYRDRQRNGFVLPTYEEMKRKEGRKEIDWKSVQIRRESDEKTH